MRLRCARRGSGIVGNLIPEFGHSAVVAGALGGSARAPWRRISVIVTCPGASAARARDSSWDKLRCELDVFRLRRTLRSVVTCPGAGKTGARSQLIPGRVEARPAALAPFP